MHMDLTFEQTKQLTQINLVFFTEQAQKIIDRIFIALIKKK